MMQSTLAAPSDRQAAAALEALTQLLHWLEREALPRWIEHGVDRRCGGYHEKLALDGQPIHEPRRTRVVARQIYVFATAGRIGWHSGGLEAARHGLDFLLQRLRLPDGLYASAVAADGRVVRPTFDLYEQAFALFGLAHAHRAGLRHGELQPLALESLHQLRLQYGHPGGGFHGACPAAEPLQSNPHMHLLEAALAWAESPEASPSWAELADELVALALKSFVDAGTGAIRENFDLEWRVMGSALEARVEPGHQFEWAWLLRRWADLRPQHFTDIERTCARLARVGERHGIDVVHGEAVDALRGDLRLLDGHMRLWPQTERLKYWSDEARRAVGAPRCWPEVSRAAEGLRRFLLADAPGLWREVLQPDGRFVREPCRASSLYHIVGAMETAHDLLSSVGSVSTGARSKES